MKIYKNLVLPMVAMTALAACDHTVSMETTVHPDGKLDKTITLELKDSARSILNLGRWDKKIIEQKSDRPDSARKMETITSFSKHFNSAEEVNAELAAPSDSLFQITTRFEKKFRWFYTYIYYSETFHSLNRMELKPDDYLTQEDYAFIDRLPAEGKKISKADNFYLRELNNRIFDAYGMRAFYEEYFALTGKLITENKVESRWLDTLAVHKEDIFEMLENKKDIPEDFLLSVMDSLHIPMDYRAVKSQYDAMYKKLSAKTGFISLASDGKYTNRINLPWPVVRTNADSTAGNTLIWAPPSIKFLLKDYTMYGECRTLNGWAVIVSILIVGFTGYLFVRKRN